MIAGKIVSGLGRGAKFLQIPNYQQEIERVLGFVPYPGTLNIQIDPKKRETLLDSLELQHIPEFEYKNRAYGAVWVGIVNVVIGKNSVPCGLIVPEKSYYKDIIEIIHPEYLKSLLNLKNGDIVKFK